jgi:membrane protease YdiL (CAAX protease family)
MHKNVTVEYEQPGRELRPLLFYALAFVIAWAAWTPLLLHKFDALDLSVPFPIVLFIGQTIGAFAPLLSLFVIQRISHDSGLVRRVFSRLRFRGIPVWWYLVPALTPVVVTIATTLCHGLLSGEASPILRPEPVRELGWALLAVIPFQFMLGMIGSPLGEEPGWRGYILDGFARKGRALAGSAIVACLWWIWHLPLFLVLGVDPTGYNFLVMAAHSLLLDSLFLLSGRNLLVAMLYHQGINTSFMFFVSKAETPVVAAIFLIVALVARLVTQRAIGRPVAPQAQDELV